VTARDRLAGRYESAGRFADAISVYSTALADRERSQGPGHTGHDHRGRETSPAPTRAPARPAEAVVLYEQMVTTADRHLGPGHPVTPGPRGLHLAGAYHCGGPGQGGADRVP